jgi:hypothetical protein
MATKERKKIDEVSRAALMRAYWSRGNPTATPSEVAKKFKTTYQIAVHVRERDEQEPKR